MADTDSNRLIRYGDSVLFISKDRDSYVRTLTPGGNLTTQLGRLDFDNLIGQPYGSAVMPKLFHRVVGVLKSGQPFGPNWVSTT